MGPYLVVACWLHDNVTILHQFILLLICLPSLVIGFLTIWIANVGLRIIGKVTSIFCDAYYSSSLQHETEFHWSKLGYLLSHSHLLFQCNIAFKFCVHVCSVFLGLWPSQSFGHCQDNIMFMGQLLHHMRIAPHASISSPLWTHTIGWSWGEECNNLHRLMLHFNSELELQLNELGRSLLYMATSLEEA